MSAAEQRLFGHWDQLKGKIKEHWGQITDDELAEVEGQYDQLVGLIQQKTGEARQQIKRVIDELARRIQRCVRRRQRSRPRIRRAANEAMHETAERSPRAGPRRLRAGHEVVRRRPAESVAVAFGTGLLVGVIVGLIRSVEITVRQAFSLTTHRTTFHSHNLTEKPHGSQIPTQSSARHRRRNRTPRATQYDRG